MDSKDTILPSKITKPALPRNFLRRDRLVEAMSAMEESLVLISASMGYGKTVVMTHFAQTHPCGWYHLDETDNDVMVFVRYFVKALQRVVPGFSLDVTTHSSVGMQEVSARNLALDCAEALYRADAQQLRLVLDDFHVITNGLVLVFLTTLVEHTEGTLQLFICSKSAMPAAFARLVVSQRAVYISAKELAFTQEEVYQLSRAVVPSQAPELVAQTLHTGLEGWPVGVMFALLHVRSGGGDMELDLEAIADMPHLRDYFMHELFRKLPFDLQYFLSRTAILEYLQPEVCNLLTGRTDGASQLAYLEQENLFVIRTAGGQKVYRYHALFRQFLTSLSRPEVLQEMAGKVAIHCLATGNHHWAIEYGVQSHNGALLQQVVEAVGRSLLENGELDTLRYCLESLEKQQVAFGGRLLLLRGWYHQRLGQWPQAVEDGERVMTQGDAQPQERVEAACLLALVARGQKKLAESEGYLQKALPSLPQRKQASGWLYGMAACIHVYNLLDLGQGHQALAWVEESHGTAQQLVFLEKLKAICQLWLHQEVGDREGLAPYLAEMEARGLGRPVLAPVAIHPITQETPEVTWLQVQCFGKLQVTTPDGQQLHWRTRKTKELFAYLYHRKGQCVPKEQLMDMLWPQVTPSNATSLFHTSLYNIRKALSGYEQFANLITHSKGGYCMDATLVQGDRHVVDGFAKEGTFPQGLWPERLYAGGYLEDIEGTWCTDARAQYGGIFLRMYRRFAVEAMDRGDERQALSFLRAVAVQEPYDEGVAGLLIQAYTALGEMKNAMAVYAGLKEILIQELGVEPGEEVTRVYRQCLLKRLESRRNRV